MAHEYNVKVEVTKIVNALKVQEIKYRNRVIHSTGRERLLAKERADYARLLVKQFSEIYEL